MLFAVQAATEYAALVLQRAASAISLNATRLQALAREHTVVVVLAGVGLLFVFFRIFRIRR